MDSSLHSRVESVVSWLDIAETEACIETKDKSFYKKDIEMLEKRWNKCITFEGDYVNEWSWILSKPCCFIIQPTNLLSDVYCTTGNSRRSLVVRKMDFF